MIMLISTVTITKNEGDIITEMLRSIEGQSDELLVDDEGSTDGTVELVKKYGGKVFTSRGKTLGQRKQGLIEKAKGDWILILDADERVSKELKKEIKQILDPRVKPEDDRKRRGRRDDPSTTLRVNGYRIPYQNFVFGKPVYFGGENYAKVRLFRLGKGRVSLEPLHEEVTVEGKIGRLEGKILHHSYRTPVQLFIKFTNYARISAGEKRRARESVTLRKLFFYGPHMFWARFIKEKGYRDGFHGFILAFAFAYMESLTYWYIFLRLR